MKKIYKVIEKIKKVQPRMFQQSDKQLVIEAFEMHKFIHFYVSWGYICAKGSLPVGFCWHLNKARE